MSKVAVDAPPSNDLYDQDFYAWTQKQAQLLRERRWGELDLENLVDEVQSVGSSERREIRNRVKVLLVHLLKWKFQPRYRGSSWRRTIRDQREAIGEAVKDSPSLRPYPARAVAIVYTGATLEASDQTGLAVGLFPNECPFSSVEVFDERFFPEDVEME